MLIHQSVHDLALPSKFKAIVKFCIYLIVNGNTFFFLNFRWGLVGHMDVKEVDLRAKPFTEKTI